MLRGLAEDGANHAAAHVGEAEVSAVVSIGESFVVESETVEDGGM